MTYEEYFKALGQVVYDIEGQEEILQEFNETFGAQDDEDTTK